MNLRTCASWRESFRTLRSSSSICCPMAVRAVSSGLTAAVRSGRSAISSLARAVKTERAVADDETEVLEQGTDLVLKIAFDLNQQRPARQQRLDCVAIKVLDAHFLEPAGLHDTSDAGCIVAVALVDLHLEHRFGMACIDADYRQAKPLELGPKPSCSGSSLKADPNRTRRFRPHKSSNRFRGRIDHALSHDRSRLVHHTDRRLLQRHV